MSSEGFHKKKCFIKKLDFENCIVTSIRTKARRRRKLRARITRERQSSDEESLITSPVLTPKPYSRIHDQTSSSLAERQYNEPGSPVFLKRKRLEFSFEKSPEVSSVEEIPPSPSSPVFKLPKKCKINESAESEPVISEEDSSVCLQSSCQIDDATTQESKESVKISSVESGSDVKNVNLNYSIEAVSRNSPGAFKFAGFQTTESPKPTRRHYKKNSLLRRLHKLQQKQASEKLLWQHQNKRNSASSLKASVISFWNEEFIFFLKCRSISSDPETIYVIADSRWAPNLREVKKASVIQVHPPWQKIFVEDLNVSALINVICLDVLEETVEPVIQKEVLQSVPVEKFKTDQKLFIESLLLSRTSGFLY